MKPLARLQNQNHYMRSAVMNAPTCCFLFSLLVVTSLLLGLLSSFCLIQFDDAGSRADPARLMVQQVGELHVETHSAGAMELKSTVAAHRQSQNHVCDGQRIYMYDLPEEFNAGILQQCRAQIVPWLNFCAHIEHHGFGRRSSVNSTDWADWYETDPYMLELIFHSRMAFYPCITQVAAQADAFFIPYYSGLDALHYLYGKRKRKWGEHGLKLVRWLQEHEGGKHWRRRGGRDHFIVMGRTAWDFTRYPSSRLIAAAQQGGRNDASDDNAENYNDDRGWGTGFANLPEMGNVTALFLERRPSQAMEQAIPYPTGFHPSSLQSLRTWQHNVQTANRTFLMAFVGAPRPSESCSSELHRNIRQAAIEQCAGSPTTCSLWDCSKLKCAHASVQIAQRLLNSHFCLQPPGDTATRRSTFDGLLSGCIPVFFVNDSAYNQYTWHFAGLQPSSYSVFVPEQELHHVLPLLSSFSAERIARMRSFIVEHLITRIMYASPQLAASHPSLRDAFQLTVDNMLRRAASSHSSLISW